ncbi:MAG: DUF2188 domain-containing protein [Metamycoplasmataceae bacterium]
MKQYNGINKMNLGMLNDQKEQVAGFSNSSASKTASKISGRNIYYVSARKDKTGKKIGWEIKKENASKVTRIVDTKEEALAIVKELAGNNESTVIIRKVDGSIQETIKFKNK